MLRQPPRVLPLLLLLAAGAQAWPASKFTLLPSSMTSDSSRAPQMPPPGTYRITAPLKADDGGTATPLPSPAAAKRLHFINDLTNALTCTNPFHKRGDPLGFTTAVLDACVPGLLTQGVPTGSLGTPPRTPWTLSR